jgi:histidine triad (HIT) family protein
MDDCVFCKIVRGEFPSHRVYEDDTFIAFLDIRPLSAGHLLITPKQHYRWVWDTPNIGSYFEIVQKMAHALQKAFGVEEVCAKVIGEEVHHAHVWLYPAPDKSTADKNDFVGNAEKIRQAL